MDFGTQVTHQYPGMSTTQGIYRAAFPLYKIYVFGKEVSGDTISVRVNQSGGSQDRATSTCSVTLANLQYKYVITHTDMMAMSYLRNSEDSSIIVDEDIALSSLSNSEDRSPTVKDVYSSDSIFSALGSRLTSGEMADLKSSWSMGKVPLTIKGSVLSKKVYKKGAIDNEGNQLHFYPLAEGDSIFHPNDPIRVAFRDPFDPRVWYWQFSGFVDGFTEEEGVNQDSTLTLACSDVLKSVRYALIQTNTDAVKDAKLTEEKGAGTINAQNLQYLKWITTQNMFAKLTLPEILDALFFGARSSTTEEINAVSRWKGLLTELQNDSAVLNKLSEVYITATTSKSKTQLSPEQISTGIVEDISARWGNLKTLEGLKTPAGTQFKRNPDQYWGIYPYYIKGSTVSVNEGSFYDVVDKAFSQGTTLQDLNDMLHHKVRPSDLEVMRKETSDLSADLFLKKMSEGGAVSSTAVPGSVSDPVQIIDIIGSDMEQYPVGGGRVFFIAPAGLQGGLITGLTDEDTTGGSSDMHSEYKDLLTYLFDLADQIAFCCYATPRGDVVFEMPLCDYNPWDFTNEASTFARNADTYSDAALVARSAVNATIDKWSKGESKYNADAVYSMLQASSALQLLDSGFSRDEGSALFNSYMNAYTPGVDYASYFTVEQHDSMSFSNSLSDTAVKTFSRVAPHTMEGFKAGQDLNLSDYTYSYAYASIDMLGFRMTADVTPWTRVATPRAAQMYADWELRKANAEARNIGLQVVPKFGLMVNRPLYWRKRNYVANIVNLQHSITANSACGTTINLNYGRAWTGKVDSNGRDVFEHLGGQLPMNYARLVVDPGGDKRKPEVEGSEAAPNSQGGEKPKKPKKSKKPKTSPKKSAAAAASGKKG